MLMQLCRRKVDTKAVMTVRMKLPIFSAEKFFLKSFIKFKKLKLIICFAGLCPAGFLTFFGAKKEAKRHPPIPSPSLYGRGVIDSGQSPPSIKVLVSLAKPLP